MNTLIPFQNTGAAFLASRAHAALLDEPGLGKTVQACEALRRVKARHGIIITTAAPEVKDHWRQHLIDWTEVKPWHIFIFQSGKDEIPAHTNWIIVNYELLNTNNVLREICLFRERYDTIICDEAHLLKSFTSKRSHKILGNGSGSLISRAYYKWLLSGSIMPNRPMEMYPAVVTLASELITPYDDYDKFGVQFCGGVKDDEGNYRGASNIPDLRERLSGKFYLRREVKDVYRDMPEVCESDVFIDVGDLPSGADETNESQARLRKEIGIAKLPYIIEYVDYAMQDINRLLVFTYHRAVTEGVAYSLEDSYSTVTYYGGMTPKLKALALKTFKEMPGKCILVAQVNSAGVALDGLQKVCNNVIFAEPDWSGGGYEQNLGRLKRIGQDKSVNATLLIAKNTLDETIAAVRRRKQRVIAQLLNDNQHKMENDDMAMEDAINRLAAAIEENNSLLKNHKGNADPKTEAKVTAGASAAQTAAKPGASTSPKAATGAKPAASSKATAAATPKGPTLEEVRTAAKDALIRMGSTDEAKGEVKQVCLDRGGASVKEIDQKHWAEVLEIYNEMGLEGAEEGEEDPGV